MLIKPYQKHFIFENCDPNSVDFLLVLVSASTRRHLMNDLLQEVTTPSTGPTFDTSVPGNLTGLVGKTAYLNCRVKNLGNRTVSCLGSQAFSGLIICNNSSYSKKFRIAFSAKGLGEGENQMYYVKNVSEQNNVN